MILTADETFLFWPTIFSRVIETLAVVALRDRNWRSKFSHLVYDVGYLAD